MLEFLLFALLPRFDDEPPARVGEFDGAAFAFPKIAGSDLLAVDEG